MQPYYGTQPSVMILTRVIVEAFCGLVARCCLYKAVCLWVEDDEPHPDLCHLSLETPAYNLRNASIDLGLLFGAKGGFPYWKVFSIDDQYWIAYGFPVGETKCCVRIGRYLASVGKCMNLPATCIGYKRSLIRVYLV